MMSSVHFETLLHASLSLLSLLIIFREGCDVVSLSLGLSEVSPGFSLSLKSLVMLPLSRCRENKGVACTSKQSHKLDAPEYPLEVHELLAEARSLEDTVSSELIEQFVFLELAFLRIEQASLKQLEILRIGVSDGDELGLHSLIFLADQRLMFSDVFLYWFQICRHGLR